MDLGLIGQFAIVTGAAKGIGLATAHRLTAEGVRVAMFDVDESISAIAAQIPSAIGLCCDVSRSADVERAVGEAVKHFGGRLQLLINVAGIQTYGTVTETSEEMWDRTIDVNLKSAFLCAKYALPIIVKSGGGVVVNLSSAQAFMSQHNVAAYVTSKTAMLGLTRSIAVDYAPTVRCVAICPGAVDTPMLRWSANQSPDPEVVLQECRDMAPLGRLATPDEVGSLVTYVCSPLAGFMTGQPVRIDGGLNLSIPGSKRS